LIQSNLCITTNIRTGTREYRDKRSGEHGKKHWDQKKVVVVQRWSLLEGKMDFINLKNAK